MRALQEGVMDCIKEFLHMFGKKQACISYLRYAVLFFTLDLIVLEG